MVKVSIILPTYNGERFIAHAIESVLQQTFHDWELLVISDGSIDQTKNIVAQFSDDRIVFIENENNIGIQKTLNKGLQFAKGEYIARLDDDDRWTDINKLTFQVGYMDEHTHTVLIGTGARAIDEHGKYLSKNIMPETDKEIRSRMLFKNNFLHATVLIRASALLKTGGYSEEKQFLHAEDYELWMRLGKEGTMYNLPILAAELVQHTNSVTFKNRILQAKNILNVVKRYKNDYPYFLFGYSIAYIRYDFFRAISVFPFSKTLFYFIQRIYKKI